MTKKMREIITIDEDLCDGCGQCIVDCEEGALQIIDGKAKLVKESLCDGFGNCVGGCPQDAITIIKREADDFDEAEVEEHLKTFKPNIPSPSTDAAPHTAPQPATPLPTTIQATAPSPHHHGGGCPGSAMRSFDTSPRVESDASETTGEIKSTLTQWPVQLMLVPPTAPFLKGREILLAADCCPFAYADFHRKHLKGKALLVGCPKLDDLNHYRQKLEDTFRDSGCTGVTVMIMEVPCCGGLNMVAREALKASGANIPLKEIVIGIRGEVLQEKVVA
jgi:NAD-dependent dihydropyrimidine dehydrogenase PreA subunit